VPASHVGHSTTSAHRDYVAWVASPTTLTPPPELDQRLLGPRRHHWRGWLTTLAAALTAAVVAGVVLNFLGMLPWRGPLSTSGARAAAVSATFEVHAGDRIAYPLLFISNPSRVGVVLDSIEPVDATPGIDVTGAWLFVDSARCRSQRPNVPSAVPAACRLAFADQAIPGHQYGSDGSRVIVILKPSAPGTYRASGFDVHYHVGPIHYTTTYRDGYVIHASAAPPPHRHRDGAASR
jgi:hypothetical protein